MAADIVVVAGGGGFIDGHLAGDLLEQGSYGPGRGREPSR